MDEEHDIGWAVAKMRDGFKVRRPHWAEGFSLFLSADGENVNCQGEPHEAGMIHTLNLLASDWELAQ